MADLIVSDGTPTPYLVGQDATNPAAQSEWRINSSAVVEVHMVRPDAAPTPADADYKTPLIRNLATTSEDLKASINIKSFGDGWVSAGSFSPTGTSDLYASPWGVLHFHTLGTGVSTAISIRAPEGGSGSGSSTGIGIDINYTDSSLSQFDVVAQANWYLNEAFTTNFNNGRGFDIDGLYETSYHTGPSTLTGAFSFRNWFTDGIGSSGSITIPASQSFYTVKDWSVDSTDVSTFGKGAGQLTMSLTYTKADSTSGGASKLTLWQIGMRKAF